MVLSWIFFQTPVFKTKFITRPFITRTDDHFCNSKRKKNIFIGPYCVPGYQSKHALFLLIADNRKACERNRRPSTSYSFLLLDK